MAKTIRKSYFQEPTAGEIKQYSRIRDISRHFVGEIEDLCEDEALILHANLIPKSFRNGRHFLKHGPEVMLPRRKTLEEAIRYRKTPVQLREMAFDGIRTPFHPGYSIMPFVGKDQRKRRFSLVEELEGAKIFAYSHQNPATGIEVKPYDDSAAVETQGAEIIVSVPSRTQKQPRHKFKFSSVPIVDSKEKWGIAHNIATDHTCDRKRFDIRYRYKDDKESSRVFNFCAHEAAAYLAIIDHYWLNEKNIRPLEMSQFAIPTQDTVDFYRKLSENCLIQGKDETKPRKLTKAEKEILLWGLVQNKGHDATFFATEKVRDYDWGK
jgi:hypothetical protein